MRKLKKALTSFTMILFISLNSINTYASVFNDIKKEDVGYNAIINMFSLGIMIGDLQGNFAPETHISKFETAEIIAKIYGYNNEKINNDKYEKLVSEYSKKYIKWNDDSNNAIIFLLTKEILTEEDLAQFIILDKENKEQKRALSREELALFLTRASKKEEEANKTKYNKTFKDESKIDNKKISLCYYMDSIGIITADKDNKFYPNNAITKAELAIILDKFIQHNNIQISVSDNSQEKLENIHSRVVTITKVFPSNNTIQVQAGYESQMYKLSNNAAITIDTVASYLVDIKENTNAEIFIKDNLVYKIDAKSNLQIKKIENENKNNKKMYGTIKNITENTIGLSYKIIDEDTFSIKEKIDIISIDKNCKITKSGVAVKNIEADSLATIVLKDGKASHIILEEINSIFMGVIIEKQKDEITIKTTDEKIFQIKFSEKSKIFRNNIEVNFEELKIGDTVNIKTNKDKIEKIEAKGLLNEKEGTIKSIKIDSKFSTITIENLKGNLETFCVDTKTVDIYSLKIDDKIKMKLDSQEIYLIEILERI